MQRVELRPMIAPDHFWAIGEERPGRCQPTLTNGCVLSPKSIAKAAFASFPVWAAAPEVARCHDSRIQAERWRDLYLDLLERERS